MRLGDAAGAGLGVEAVGERLAERQDAPARAALGFEDDDVVAGFREQARRAEAGEARAEDDDACGAGRGAPGASGRERGPRRRRPRARGSPRRSSAVIARSRRSESQREAAQAAVHLLELRHVQHAETIAQSREPPLELGKPFAKKIGVVDRHAVGGVVLLGIDADDVPAGEGRVPTRGTSMTTRRRSESHAMPLFRCRMP